MSTAQSDAVLRLKHTLTGFDLAGVETMLDFHHALMKHPVCGRDEHSWTPSSASSTLTGAAGQPTP